MDQHVDFLTNDAKILRVVVDVCMLKQTLSLRQIVRYLTK
jgi:hypothetical protein